MTYQDPSPFSTQPYQAQPGYGPFDGGAQGYGYYLARPPFRVGDMIVSIILLTIGLLVTVNMIFVAFTLETAMQEQYTSYGLGTYQATNGLTVASAAILISHVVLLAIATPLTIVLIRKRMLSFWLPLIAGAIAAIIFWVAIFGIILSDQKLMSYFSTTQY